MIQWQWTWEHVEPDDVLDAARTIETNSYRVTIDLASHWVDARRYLGWASLALSRGGEEAWDSAAGWAKRAVCRRMDGILVHNHLGDFLGRNYKKKAEYLMELEVPGLSLLQDMVIDPRNDIEHSYAVATEGQARRAHDLAELFLGATEVESAIPLIVALGWNVSYRGQSCSKPGQEYEVHEFSLDHERPPMLLIDGYCPVPEALVIHPRDETVLACPRRSFSSAQITELNARVRQCLASANYSSRFFSRALMKTLRDQLRLWDSPDALGQSCGT